MSDPAPVGSAVGALSGVTQVTAAYSATNGNLLLITCAGWNNDGIITTLTLTSSRGETIPSPTVDISSTSGNESRMQVYIVPVAHGGASDTWTLTASGANSAASDLNIDVLEYSGCDAAGTTDGVNSNQATAISATSVNTGSITTTNAKDLLFTALWDQTNSQTFTYGSGFTGRNNNQNPDAETSDQADRLVLTTGTYSNTFTGGTASNSLLAAIIAIKAAAGTQTNKTLSVTSAVTVALIKRAGINRSVTSSVTPVLVKQPRKTFAVTTAATPVLVRRISKTLAYTTAATVTFAEGLLLKMTKAVTTAATVGFSQKQIATQLFSVTTAATVGIVKSVGKVLVAAVSGATVGLTKRITKVPFTVTTAATVSLAEQLSLHKTFGVLTAVTVGFALTKVKQLVFSITTAVSLAFTATFIPATVITLTAGRKIIRQLFNFLARR